MNAFIESLKRLYDNKMIGTDDVVRLFAGNKITAEEKDYILYSA